MKFGRLTLSYLQFAHSCLILANVNMSLYTVVHYIIRWEASAQVSPSAANSSRNGELSKFNGSAPSVGDCDNINTECRGKECTIEMKLIKTSAQRARTPCAGVVRRSAVSRVVHVTVEVLRLYSWACAEAGWSANRATDIHKWGVAGDGEFNEWKKGRTDGGLGEWKWWEGLELDRSWGEAEGVGSEGGWSVKKRRN